MSSIKLISLKWGRSLKYPHRIHSSLVTSIVDVREHVGSLVSQNLKKKKFKMIATQGCDCKNYYVMKGDNFDAGPFLEKKSSCTDHSFLGVNLSNRWEEMIKKYQLK